MSTHGDQILYEILETLREIQRSQKTKDEWACEAHGPTGICPTCAGDMNLDGE
jgi:hypothetical protein